MDTLLSEKIINVIAQYDKFFLSKKNVIAIGMGEKFINDININELCLKIFVEEKINKINLLKKDILPKVFLGVKLDVVEVGKMDSFFSPNTDISINNYDTLPTPKFRTRLRPIEAGCDISQYKKKESGTLGAIVFDNNSNAPYILSNNHVLIDPDNPKKPIAILQPSTPYGGSSNLNIIAMGSKYVPVKTTGYNLVDCAISKILSHIEYFKGIYNIGEILGTSDAQLKKKLRKVGAKTAYTEGEIIAIHVSCHTLSKHGLKEPFKNQIATTKMSDVGDSGSIYVDYKNRAIGLGFASSDGATFLNPISYVLKYLNIHF